MGCERIKAGVVGGLRLSVERRRMTNAKMSTLRYRRYQALHDEIQEEEMRKAHEILESRKKERERLNQYMHSLRQPPVKLSQTSKNHHKYSSFARGSDLYSRRPPWKLSLMQDHKAIMDMRQKEASLANPSLCALRQEDYDAMLQVRATATRDAIVNLRACNSRYPLPEIDRSPTPETEEGYLKNHLLRGNLLRREFAKAEIDHFSNQSIMDKTSSTLTVDPEVFPRETQFVHTKAGYKIVEGPQSTPNPSRRAAPNGFGSASYTHCTEESRDNEKISSDVTTEEAPIVNNPAELSVSMSSPPRQWYQMDGEKTSFLTEELFLASLENKAATTRLVQQITAIDQSNTCKLITLSSLDDISGCRMPQETTEIKSAHEDLDVMDQLLLSRSLHKRVTDLHNDETAVGAHERPMSNSTDPKRSNMMGHHGANLHVENTGSSIITKNMVKVKVKSQVEVDYNRMEDCSSKGPEPATCTRKGLLEPTISVHDNARILGQQCSSTRDLPSFCSEWHSSEREGERENWDSLAATRSVSSRTESIAENFEDRGRNGASAMINQHNKSNLTQRPRPGPRKVNIPQKILKSVYERCDLDSVRPPGYTVLCNAQSRKGSPIKHIQTRIGASSPLRNQPSPLLQPDQNADAINPQSRFREEGDICHHDASGNKENIGKLNENPDLCSQGSEEEFNILASLERLDYRLAAINGKSPNSERNCLNSGQLSSKSTQSAPLVLIQRGAASSSHGGRNHVAGKPKKFPCNPPRPSSAKLLFQKPARGLRQRQVIGITNKCKVKPHELYSASPINYPPVVFPDVNPRQLATSSFRGP